MRFILFNIAVGTALVYLFNTGTLPLGDLRANVDRTAAKVVAWSNAKTSQPKLIVQPSAKIGTSGQKNISERQVVPREEIPIPGPRRSAKEAVETGRSFNKLDRPNSQQAPPPKIKAQESTKGPAVRHALSKTQDSRAYRTKTRDVKLPALKQRFTIKTGASMMSASDRKRELDALAEEMELLYIKKLGG